jgi:tetratricopeptide (TPR) repeat protein
MEATSHHIVGTIHLAAGDIAQAREEFELTLAAAQRSDFRRTHIDALLGLAQVAITSGDPADALRLADEALDLAGKLSSRVQSAQAILMAAYAHRDLGDAGHAYATASVALTAFTETGYRDGIRLAAELSTELQR